jgi:hypothetical protein
MPTKDDVLREKTFKGEGTDPTRRVFDTLTQQDLDQVRTPDFVKLRMVMVRNSKAIALITKRLLDQGLLTEADLDDLLFDVVM